MPASESRSRVGSLFAVTRRPRAQEVEFYARLIAEREGGSFAACCEQAELQLWATSPTRPRKISSRALRRSGDSMAVPV